MTPNKDALAELGWLPILNGESTREDVDQRIEEQSTIALDRFREELAGKAGWTEAHRQAALAFAEPIIRRQTHDVLEGAWLRLRNVQ